MLRRFLVGFRSRPKAHLGLAFAVVANHLSLVALAAGPSVAAAGVQAERPLAAFCSHAINLPGCAANGGGSLQVSLPDGTQACPGSEAATCSAADSSAKVAAGIATTPDGQLACGIPGGKPATSSPAACTDTVLPAPNLDERQSVKTPVVNPSVPTSSLQPTNLGRVQLTASATLAMPDRGVVLTATASGAVTDTGNSIEIFDQSSGTLVGACAEGSQCAVAYSAKGGLHTFIAFVSPPGTQMPAAKTAMTSNTVSVSWIGVSLSAANNVIGPGRFVTMTATSTIPVDKFGLLMQLYDAHTRARLAYCASGSSCSTSLTQPVGGAIDVVAVLAKPSATFPAPENLVAQSQLVSATWLSVSTEARLSSLQVGTTIDIRANANVDLSNTPWSLGIYDDHGQLVGPPCKTGSSCTAQVTFEGGTPKFSSAIGSVPSLDTSNKLSGVLKKVAGPDALVNIQARSAAVVPQTIRLIWGVDSCKSFTDDPNGGTGLLPQVKGILGTPDFWGRYLTPTVCPGISAAEIQAAHVNHMGILPIYDDYNCSDVVGYAAGAAYAAAATAAAASLGIPQGHALVIDIEPPGDACPGAANVDPGFIQGWYDGVAAAKYVPAYYGNGSGGSEFASAWCATVASRPEIASNSYLWSFEPSLIGNFSKGSSPGYSPNVAGCPGHSSAWQYMLSAGSDPDVDHDELVTEMPIWFP